MSSENEYQQGVRDCAKGIAHKTGKSKWYDMGYAAQYELEQREAQR